MIVTLRFFSVLREAFGAGVVEVELDPETTGEELIAMLAASNEEVEKLHSVIRLAINDEYVDLETALNDGDDVAVITPVSGG